MYAYRYHRFGILSVGFKHVSIILPLEDFGTTHLLKCLIRMDELMRI